MNIIHKAMSVCVIHYVINSFVQMVEEMIFFRFLTIFIFPEFVSFQLFTVASFHFIFKVQNSSENWTKLKSIHAKKTTTRQSAPPTVTDAS